jgi:hypothetical protein
MTAPMPLSIATAAKSDTDLPELWERMQQVQAVTGKLDSRKAWGTGIVEVLTLYHVPSHGEATLEVEFIWETGQGRISFYSYNQPANQGQATAMLTISSEASPIPLLSIEESLPGRRLGEIVELPPEIAEIGDYVINDIHDSRDLHVFEIHLKP